MPPQKAFAVPIVAALLAVTSAAGSSLARAAAARTHADGRTVGSHSPYRSAELWATINVCSPKNAPDVVGVRGSMPPDGDPTDAMYMRFRLQYYEATTGKWLELGRSADSGMLAVGLASTSRQYGRSFTLATPAAPVKLRGLVSFEWLRDKRVVFATQRVTTVGHKSVAGADPPGYSAATCPLS